MDSTKLILTGAVSPPVPLAHLSATPLYEAVAKADPSKVEGFSEERKKQIAKDFESVLLNKLLDEMKNTIGGWDGDEDGASEQVQGIFWLHLARHIADNGGLGMWKDIYQFLTKSADASPTAESLDKNI